MLCACCWFWFVQRKMQTTCAHNQRWMQPTLCVRWYKAAYKKSDFFFSSRQTNLLFYLWESIGWVCVHVLCGSIGTACSACDYTILTSTSLWYCLVVWFCTEMQAAKFASRYARVLKHPFFLQSRGRFVASFNFVCIACSATVTAYEIQFAVVVSELLLTIRYSCEKCILFSHFNFEFR